MYFTYDLARGINVEKPYQRMMMPYMMPDTASCPVNFSVHLTEWDPGSQVDEHLHEAAIEAMFCISGHGTASIGDQVYEFSENSMIAAAPGELHCIKNTGNEVLRCLCVFSPPMTASGLRQRAKQAAQTSEAQEND
ncbi:MAG: cupin domain-containing protein [Anaerotruncus sp.]|nr:cupin domain-containing protein [Anaerotruncus sp.]